MFAALWELRAQWTVTTGVRRYFCGAVRNRALSARRRTRLEARWAERWGDGAAWLLRRAFHIDRRQLAVVAFVQDQAGGEVLNAVQVPGPMPTSVKTSP